MSTFDPETQQFVPANGTVPAYSQMSAFSVFRDFINNAFGRTAKPFDHSKAVLKKPIIQRVAEPEPIIEEGQEQQEESPKEEEGVESPKEEQPEADEKSDIHGLG